MSVLAKFGADFHNLKINDVAFAITLLTEIDGVGVELDDTCFERSFDRQPVEQLRNVYLLDEAIEDFGLLLLGPFRSIVGQEELIKGMPERVGGRPKCDSPCTLGGGVASGILEELQVSRRHGESPSCAGTVAVGAAHARLTCSIMPKPTHRRGRQLAAPK